LLAEEIRKDLPDLTVHDVSHLDSLWEVASLVTGDNYSINPAEAYVLGGAFLLHDLAMSVAATPGGFKGLQADPRYRDLTFAGYQEKFGRAPRGAEVENPDPAIRQSVLFELLRQLHAENAEKLAFHSYPFGSDRLYLIEDTELRQTFGRIIGQVAHSHWWAIGEVERRFSRVLGAPPWAPSEWTTDPIKLACILRAADAAHLDARRAPLFLKAFSRIGAASLPHWQFQEKLNKPYRREDAIVFTSGQSFALSEANAWWLCFESLRMVDRELRSIDALLSDRSMPRFSARRVGGADLPERLAEYVQTSDWLPINATVHISDLPHIVRSIGGEELYGKHPTVPLRELVQNSADAIRARRVYEQRSDDFGGVYVSIEEADGGWYLEVADDGIGMSQRVLTDFLLDFGRSFWSSPQLQEEFPGLLSSGFQPTGKYGIGFFSVFMVADSVKVTTRRSDAGAKDTLILEFGSGLSGRPILRPATKREELRDAGTTVRIKLNVDPFKEGGLLHPHEGVTTTLLETCLHTAPALDAKLVVREASDQRIAVEANDWKSIPGDKLLSRLTEASLYERKVREAERTQFTQRAANNLRTIVDGEGRVIGRACITIGHADYRRKAYDVNGVVVCGGLAQSHLSGICGVLVGRSTRASRDTAEPLASTAELKKWAEAQAALVPELYETPQGQAACAQNIRLCGGDTCRLPIAIHKGKWVSKQDIEEMRLSDTIIIVDHFVTEVELVHISKWTLDDNVFVTRASGVPVIFQGRGHGVWTTGAITDVESEVPRSLSGAVIEAVAVAWGVPMAEVATENDFERESEVRIGSSDTSDIRTSAYVVVRPSSRP
jgi:hypothetical protein